MCSFDLVVITSARKEVRVTGGKSEVHIKVDPKASYLADDARDMAALWSSVARLMEPSA